MVVLAWSLAVGPVVAVQEQSEFWSPGTFFQGDSGSVTLALYGDTGGCGCGPTGVDQVYIARVGVQLDWQTAGNESFSTEVNGNLVTGSTRAYVVKLSIPANVTVGTHSYSVYYAGQMGGRRVLATGSLYVHDASERVYGETVSSIEQRLSSALNASFQSQEAESLLAKAQAALSQAVAAAQQGGYREAVSLLNASSGYLQQAYSSEQSHQARLSQQVGVTRSYEVFGAIVLIAGVAVGSGLIVRRRRSKG